MKGMQSKLKIGTQELFFFYGTLQPSDVPYKKNYIKGYKVYNTDYGFPITKYTGEDKDRVYGTLMYVDKDYIPVLDSIEGYSENMPKNENMYNREKVKVFAEGIEEGILAYVYIANEDTFMDQYVEGNYLKDGRWRAGVRVRKNNDNR